MSSEQSSGSCACGQVRFEIDFPTLFVSHCHCRNCRRAHGAAFVTWAGVSANKFRWAEGEDSVRAWKTPSGATRQFCSNCGSTLTYAGPKWPGETHVTLANLDCEPDQLPNSHAFPDEAPSWCPIHE